MAASADDSALVDAEMKAIHAEYEWMLRDEIPTGVWEIGQLLLQVNEHLNHERAPTRSAPSTPKKDMDPKKLRLLKMGAPSSHKTNHDVCSESKLLTGSVALRGTQIVDAELQLKRPNPKGGYEEVFHTTITPGKPYTVDQLHGCLATVTCARQCVDEFSRAYKDGPALYDILRFLKELHGYVVRAKELLSIAQPPLPETSFRAVRTFTPPIPQDMVLEFSITAGKLSVHCMQVSAASSAKPRRRASQQALDEALPSSRRPLSRKHSENFTGYQFEHNAAPYTVTLDERATCDVQPILDTMRRLKSILLITQTLQDHVSFIESMLEPV
eukprot:m.145352 g.145352  ORF g.145352 m.145352 type:complete len:328 (-) comp14141_c1_seq1:79-1062(-)